MKWFRRKPKEDTFVKELQRLHDVFYREHGHPMAIMPFPITPESRRKWDAVLLHNKIFATFLARD